jgi:hypothetical protein
MSPGPGMRGFDCFGGTAVVSADGGSSTEKVGIRDRRDPVTFAGARLGCSPLGGFKSDDFGVKVGTTLLVHNEGGESHTFTNVTTSGFTGGCQCADESTWHVRVPVLDPFSQGSRPSTV